MNKDKQYYSAFKFVPEHVWYDLKYDIARHELNKPVNLRACRWQVHRERDAYIKSQRRGKGKATLKSFDAKQVDIHGVTWNIGCNYTD
tara:strand:+ start:840 stop:1103 length:264 start_codon:yes stop_codon:yes gene_type:complete